MNISFRLIVLVTISLLIGCNASNTVDQPSPIDDKSKIVTNNFDQINEEALQHIMDGQLYLDQGDFAMAIVELQEAQHLEPNVTSIYVTLSECYWYLNKPDRAMEYLDAALEIDPNDIDALSLKAEQNIRLQNLEGAKVQYVKLSEIDPINADYSLALGDIAKLQKNYDEAVKYYDEAYSKEGDAIALELAADLSHRLGKFEEANKYYTQLIELDSINVLYLSALSDVKVQLGEAGEAISLVKRIIDIEGDTFERQLQLGVLYGELNKYDDAINSFEVLLENDSTRAAATHFLSTIYREHNDYVNAQKYADELIELDPDSPQGYVNSALVALDQNDAEAAIQVLNPAAADFPKEYLIQYLLGFSYYQIENYKIAAVFLDNACQIVPQSRNALHLLAISNDNLQNWDISDSIYEQLIQTDSTDAQALNNFAYSLVERGDELELSKQLAELALQLEPEQAAYLDTYGWILFKLGNTKEAIKFIKKSLDVDPENAEILEHLGDVYRSLQKSEKAKEYYNRALEQNPENQSLIEKLSEF